MKTLLLIDAHAMIHRAYHALPPTLMSKDGTPTNAIYGFMLMLQKVISQFQPTHLAVCFDTPKPTFRKELFKGYQAKRPPMESTLKVQIPLIKQILAGGGIACVEKAGFEADDVIGTLAETYKKELNRVLILTGDRDLLQLVDTNVFVISPKTGVTNFILYTPDNVHEKFGVDPLRIPDYKALAGDSSDNYNTAKGIGPKTAVKLLSYYPTVEELLEHIPEIENEKWRQTLTEYKETILLFKQIATIVRDVDVQTEISSLTFEQFNPEMQDELKKLDLYSLTNKLFSETNHILKTTERQREAPAKKETKTEKSSDPAQIDLFS
jgi:DNA polymerase-1